MAHWFKTLFAATGTKTAVPDATDPSGYISYETGYGPDYQRVLGTDPLAKTIERDKLNQVLYDITGAVQQYQTHGFPDYIDATANGGTAYAYELNAIVRFTDGLNYRNTVAANTNDPSVSGWVLYNDPASAIHSATSKTTPAGADELGIYDSVSGLIRKVTFTNLWASLSDLFAPIASPSFTDTPTAPTATAGTNTNQLATTAYVDGKMVLATSVTASGTSIDFTGIPSWAKVITVMFSGVSTNGNSIPIIQLGTASGIETSGYVGTTSHSAVSYSYSIGFGTGVDGNALYYRTGALRISKISNLRYVYDGTLGYGDNRCMSNGGGKTILGTLDRIRITTVNGIDTFDSGIINIRYEG